LPDVAAAVNGGSFLEALSPLITEMFFFLYGGTNDTDVVVLIEQLGALGCWMLPVLRGCQGRQRL